MRRLVAVVSLAVLAAACARTREAAPTPLPSLEPISVFMARMTPRPSVSPSASPSAKPGGAAAANDGSAAPKTSAGSQTSSTSRLHCPSGRVTADIENVQASDAHDPYRNGDRKWNVTVSGVVSNGASATVRSVRLAVTVHGSGGRAGTADASVSQTMGPGASVPWSTSFSYRGPSKPSGDQSSVVVTGWTWAASSLSGCPT